MRRPRFTLPAPLLDRRSPEPLQHQIIRQVALAVHDGTFEPGARLPSTRRMAALLGVSRNTVLTAYGDLESRGLISGHAGSGTRVIARSVPTPPLAIELVRAIRDAQFPARILVLSDPDGNRICLRY